MRALTAVAVVSLAAFVGSVLAAFLKFSIAMDLWLLAAGLLALGLVVSSAFVPLRSLRVPIAVGLLVALGGIGATLAFRA